MREGNQEGALKYIDEAMAKLTMMNNPQEVGYVNMAIALIKHEYPQSKVTKRYRGSIGMYSGRALRYLDLYRDTYERAKLEAMNEAS